MKGRTVVITGGATSGMDKTKAFGIAKHDWVWSARV